MLPKNISSNPYGLFAKPNNNQFQTTNTKQVHNPTDAIQYILIDSAYRDPISISTTNFSFTFPQTLIYTKYLKIVWIAIPNGEYIIDAQNNTFTVSYNGSGESAINITLGNLTPAQIATSIQTQFLTLFPSSGFTMTFDNTTLQFTSTANNNFYFNVTSQKLVQILGVNLGINNSIADNLIGPNVVNMAYPSAVHLQLSSNTINPNIISAQSCPMRCTYVIPLIGERGYMSYFFEFSEFENTYNVRQSDVIQIQNINVNFNYPDGQTPFSNGNCSIQILLEAL